MILKGNQEALMECRLGDTVLYYEDIGTGRPLLLLHGMPLDHRHIARDFEPIFAKRSGWRRLYPDLPGMGKTQAPDSLANQDQILALLGNFMGTVAPGERFVVAGTSYGAYLARGLIYQRGSDIDGLFLNVPGFVTDSRPLPKPLVVHQDPAFLAALRPDEQDMLGFIVVQSLALLQEDREVFRPAGKIADKAFLQRLKQNYAFSFDVDTLPVPFPAPALFLTGRHDNWCGYHDTYTLLDNYPRATFAVLDRAGHMLALEQKSLFRALVTEWLDRVEEYVSL
jgi:pimeloyl-ACP methyl ester carboxylesterase